MGDKNEIKNEHLDELNELSKENIQHYNNLITYIRNKLSAQTPIEFEKASDNDKKVISEMIFMDCIYEISRSFLYANDALRSNDLGITFSLIRKPLRDLLACMEFLSFDRINLVEAMIKDEFETIDPSKKKIRDNIKFEMKNLVKNHPKMFARVSEESIETLFEHRFGSKEKSHTLSGYLDQSLHLITTRNESFRTNKNSLNYMPVFITPDKANVIKTLYALTVPLILGYMNQLIYFNLVVNFGYNDDLVIRELNKLIQVDDKNVEFVEKIKKFIY